jgi:hypothetical protein
MSDMGHSPTYVACLQELKVTKHVDDTVHVMKADCKGVQKAFRRKNHRVAAPPQEA